MKKRMALWVGSMIVCFVGGALIRPYGEYLWYRYELLNADSWKSRHHAAQALVQTDRGLVLFAEQLDAKPQNVPVCVAIVDALYHGGQEEHLFLIASDPHIDEQIQARAAFDVYGWALDASYDVKGIVGILRVEPNLRCRGDLLKALEALKCGLEYRDPPDDPRVINVGKRIKENMDSKVQPSAEQIAVDAMHLLRVREPRPPCETGLEEHEEVLRRDSRRSIHPPIRARAEPQR